MRDNSVALHGTASDKGGQIPVGGLHEALAAGWQITPQLGPAERKPTRINQIQVRAQAGGDNAPIGQPQVAGVA
jgi:hypothetical protein